MCELHTRTKVLLPEITWNNPRAILKTQLVSYFLQSERIHKNELFQYYKYNHIRCPFGLMEIKDVAPHKPLQFAVLTMPRLTPWILCDQSQYDGQYWSKEHVGIYTFYCNDGWAGSFCGWWRDWESLRTRIYFSAEKEGSSVAVTLYILNVK